jgi:hypothetical protein
MLRRCWMSREQCVIVQEADVRELVADGAPEAASEGAFKNEVCRSFTIRDADFSENFLLPDGMQRVIHQSNCFNKNICLLLYLILLHIRFSHG